MPKVVTYSLKRLETNNGLGFRVINTEYAHEYVGEEITRNLQGTEKGLSSVLKAALDKTVAELLADR